MKSRLTPRRLTVIISILAILALLFQSFHHSYSSRMEEIQIEISEMEMQRTRLITTFTSLQTMFIIENKSKIFKSDSDTSTFRYTDSDAQNTMTVLTNQNLEKKEEIRKQKVIKNKLSKWRDLFSSLSFGALLLIIILNLRIYFKET